MTLRARLIGGSLILIVLLAAGVIALLRATLADRLEGELQRRGVAIAKYIAADCAAPLIAEDLMALQLVVNASVHVEEEIAYVFVQDPAGAVMAHSFGAAFPVALRDANRAGVEVAPRVRRLATSLGEVYDVALPLAHGELGTVRVGLRGEGIRASVARVLQVGAAVTIACLVVFGGFVLAVDLGVTGNLTRLTEATSALGLGDLEHRLPVEGRGEFADLARAFNAMADNLQRSEEKLVDLNTLLLREVRDRTRAEDELRRSLQRYSLLFSGVSDGIYVYAVGAEGPDGRIVEVNDAGCRRLGYAREEVLGLTVADLEAPGQAASGGSAALERMNAGETVVYERVHRTRDGRPVPVEISARLFDLEGRHLVLAICRDITERRRAEAELRRASAELARQNEELKALDRLKDGFIRDVSHELKTPVAKHAMQIEILRATAARDGFADRIEGVLAIMESSVRRQQSVIKNLLGIARLEAGARSYRREPVRLDELIAGVVGDYEPELQARRIAVTLALEPLVAASDGEMLWHVFSNLVNNAIKFQRQPRGGAVEIRLAREGGAAVARVRDEGIGLEPGERERVFEKFYQATASAEGSGVGLTICRMIVEGVGGGIWFESAGRGSGATAVVSLPIEGSGGTA